MSMHKLTSLMRRAGGARELELWARYGAGARQAHLALVRADTADAVKRFAGRRTRSVHGYPIRTSLKLATGWSAFRLNARDRSGKPLVGCKRLSGGTLPPDATSCRRRC